MESKEHRNKCLDVLEESVDMENKEHYKCQDVLELLEVFCKNLDDKLDEKQQQVEACKKKTELELKLAQEIKLHYELTERLAKLSDRSSELDRVCENFSSHLTIADSDQKRLEIAKDTYQLEKELTNIRLDFRAPLTVAKGYIKSKTRKLLQPFEVPASDSEALWTLIQSTSAPEWPFASDKENAPINTN